MKKVIKFICLLFVAALIAILIIRNGAKADDNTFASFDYEQEVEEGDSVKITAHFKKSVTSHGSGTITAKYDDGTIITANIAEKILDNTPISTVSGNLHLEKAGSVTVSISMDSITYKEGNEPDQCNGQSVGTITVKSKEAKKTDFSINLNKGTIEVGETIKVNVTFEPGSEPENVSFWSSNEEVATINNGGEILGISPGTISIRVTSDSGVVRNMLNAITVVQKSEPDPGTDPNPGTTPSVKISSEKEAIKVNETTKVSATVNPSDAVVTYSSSNATVATVDASGTVTGKSAGSADITATITVDGNTYNDKVTIAVNKEDDVEPTPTPPVEGETPRISPSEVTLEAYYKETIVKSNIPVTWKSSDSNIAVVERINDLEARIVSANKAGNCDIIATANDGGKTATLKVTVVKPKNDDTRAPVLSPSTDFQLGEGASITMAADVDVTWSSDNESVATVDKNGGVVTAKSAGTAKITATSKSNGKTATVNVTVKALGNNRDSNNDGNSSNNNSNSKAFTLTPNKAQTLKVGETLQLKASEPVASWQSSKRNVASVDKNGKVTAISAGTAYISAVSIDSTVAQIKITVKEDGSVSQDTTGNVTSGNSSSQVNKEVPATGESTTEMLIVLGVVTLVVSALIFRKKTK